MLIDTHCHLNFNDFADDYQSVIKRCQEKGMKVINVGSQLSTSKKAVDLAKEYMGTLYAAVGFHPIHVADEDFNLEKLEELADLAVTVAIGETGLDYYRLYADSKKEEEQLIARQKELLRLQIGLAKKKDLPLIIHCRDAYDDLMDILKEEKVKKGVVHCFLGNKEIGQQILKLGLYVGFTGIITFTDDEKLLEFIKKAPLDKMLIETDAPYLAPAHYRGKKNEPYYVEHVAEKIAELKGLSKEEVINQTGQNAIKLFKLE